MRPAESMDTRAQDFDLDICKEPFGLPIRVPWVYITAHSRGWTTAQTNPHCGRWNEYEVFASQK